LSSREHRDVRPVTVALLALGLAAFGLMIEIQPINVASTPVTLYLGATVAVGAAVLAMGLRVRLWLRLFTLAVVALCLFNLVDQSDQLSRQRQQWQQRIQTGTTDLKNELHSG
jgi:hypothetical protein